LPNQLTLEVYYDSFKLPIKVAWKCGLGET
jgi:hypothetical protein